MQKKELFLLPKQIKHLQKGYRIGLKDSPYIFHCIVDSKGIVELTSESTNCRETFLSYMRRDQLLTQVGVSNKEYIYKKAKESCFQFAFGNTVDRSKGGTPHNVELLLHNIAIFDRRTMDAVKALNVIEDHFGWARTTVRRVNTSPRMDYHLYMFESSKRWKRSPHLASLMLLILRAARTKDWKPADNIQDVVKQFNSDGDIIKYYDKWYLLMEKFSEIFRGFSKKKMYSADIIVKSKALKNIKLVKEVLASYDKGLNRNAKICDVLFQEGIKMLCDGSTRYDIIDQRLKTYMRLKKNAETPRKKKTKKGANEPKVSYA